MNRNRPAARSPPRIGAMPAPHPGPPHSPPRSETAKFTPDDTVPHDQAGWEASKRSGGAQFGAAVHAVAVGVEAAAAPGCLFPAAERSALAARSAVPSPRALAILTRPLAPEQTSDGCRHRPLVLRCPQTRGAASSPECDLRWTTAAPARGARKSGVHGRGVGRMGPREGGTLGLRCTGTRSCLPMALGLAGSFGCLRGS